MFESWASDFLSRISVFSDCCFLANSKDFHDRCINVSKLSISVNMRVNQYRVLSWSIATDLGCLSPEVSCERFHITRDPPDDKRCRNSMKLKRKQSILRALLIPSSSCKKPRAKRIQKYTTQLLILSSRLRQTQNAPQRSVKWTCPHTPHLIVYYASWRCGNVNLARS